MKDNKLFLRFIQEDRMFLKRLTKVEKQDEIKFFTSYLHDLENQVNDYLNRSNSLVRIKQMYEKIQTKLRANVPISRKLETQMRQTQDSIDLVNLMIYINLLNMDITTEIIGLLEVDDEVLAKCSAKSAYVLIYETLKNNIDTTLHAKIFKGYVSLLDSEEKELLKDVSSKLKEMKKNKDCFQQVRNHIAAHQDANIENQVEAYNNCSPSIAFESLLALFEILKCEDRIVGNVFDKLFKLIKESCDSIPAVS